MSLTAISSTPSGGRSSGDGGLNLGYSRTIPGLLKIGQLLSLLIAFLCVRLARGWPSWYAFQFFEVVVLWFLVAFLIFFLMHLCRLQVKMPCINWPLAVRRSFCSHRTLGLATGRVLSLLCRVRPDLHRLHHRCGEMWRRFLPGGGVGFRFDCDVPDGRQSVDVVQRRLRPGSR
ncbi:CKLF-like MARVEL transmembrane domain-containing protein 7 isoform X1 [Gambusia affinis]|uniref:CKLF-like MARVEL transmembrane domain-containing protein 7 isoform X1 n=1 Tax=Gambusia affinis TaxID=33528 RepID=UPI001CDD3184|nr:CKLF-like MARVEL transmembrane domain-containing protein 7 isoform X1 [Gambusia affinis]